MTSRQDVLEVLEALTGTEVPWWLAAVIKDYYSVGVVLAGVLAGCAWSGNAAPTESGWTAYPDGTVAGQVVVRGGVQFPHHKKPHPATNTPFTFVAVPSSGTMLVRHLRTDGKGRFRLSLPPGRYMVGGTFTKSEPLPQAARKVLVVRGGRVAQVQLVESVR